MRVAVAATCEDISRSKAIFWPCVDSKMGFCDSDDACDTLWRKLMEFVAENGCATFSGRG